MSIRGARRSGNAGVLGLCVAGGITEGFVFVLSPDSDAEIAERGAEPAEWSFCCEPRMVLRQSALTSTLRPRQSVMRIPGHMLQSAPAFFARLHKDMDGAPSRTMTMWERAAPSRTMTMRGRAAPLRHDDRIARLLRRGDRLGWAFCRDGSFNLTLALQVECYQPPQQRPGSTDTPSRQHVGRPMHPQIHPAHADQERRQNG